MPHRSRALVKIGDPRPLVLRLVLAAALLALLGVLAAREASAAPSSGAVVRVAKSNLGRMLVDGRGRTLYLFQADRTGRSACSGTCASFWPPLLSKGKPHAGAGIAASRLGTIKRPGGGTQVTYAGHPLYTFSLDKKAGQTKGEGLDDFGARWYAVGTNGRKLLRRASPPPAGYGYGR
jgi:predicted lipoprotein with Yx(FWY)xxD motif